MKKPISNIVHVTLFLFGVPFAIVDYFHKNAVCEKVINNINIFLYKIRVWSK